MAWTDTVRSGYITAVRSTSIQNSWECANLPPVPSSTDNPYQTASPTSVDTFGHNARVEPANRGSDSSSATNNNGSNSPSQQNASANLPTPTSSPVPSNTASANTSTGSLENSNDTDTATGGKHHKNSKHNTINTSYSRNAFPGYPSIPYPGSHSALDASDSSKGIVTDGEPDTLAHTSGRGRVGMHGGLVKMPYLCCTCTVHCGCTSPCFNKAIQALHKLLLISSYNL
ncbi:penicillin-binding protein 1A-like [Penaeus monodon]|uniref:penicillin-binding protein 1A-like n=1 Tax=Penaeus monodon TaxID=6687 RepID=UPI0018A71EB4|nr:penicillin-binding protein 1A-like [Penaeus monodon]